MTPYERIMATLNGDPTDQIAIAPIVREWSAKQAGFNASDLTESSLRHVYAQYYCAEKFGFDLLWDIWGIQAEAEIMGSVVDLSKEMRGEASLLSSVINDYTTDLPGLIPPNPHSDGRLPMILDGIRQLKQLAKKKYPIAGYLQGPFRLASMLRGPEKLVSDFKKRGNSAEELLELSCNTQVITGAAIVHAGADFIWIGEPTLSSGSISLEPFKRFIIPCLKRLVKEIKSHKIKVMLHVCGNISDRIELLLETGIDALSVSEEVDLAEARQIVGEDFCLWGNIAPASLSSGIPSEIEEEARRCIEKEWGKTEILFCVQDVELPPKHPRQI